MRLVHLLFKGKTTSPWHVGKRAYSNYLYTRTDILWGRGIRGPVLRQIWRTYCPFSDIRDRVEFIPERDCQRCDLRSDCPFYNLREVERKGEYKDTPKIIFTNLYFEGNVRTDRIVITSIDERCRSIVERIGPVYVEYIKSGTEFSFEIILTGKGVDFKDDVIRAVKTSLKFLGWGGFCNEGFGRGEITRVEERNFNKFDEFITKLAEAIVHEYRSKGEIRLKIAPLLILEKSNGFYTSTIEEGFKDKFLHSIVERYWQLYKDKKYPKIKNISGEVTRMKIRGWSRKDGGEQIFEGMCGELVIKFEDLNLEDAKVIAISRYGIGKWKNQGFGSLIPIF